MRACPPLPNPSAPRQQAHFLVPLGRSHPGFDPDLRKVAAKSPLKLRPRRSQPAAPETPYRSKALPLPSRGAPATTPLFGLSMFEPFVLDRRFAWSASSQQAFWKAMVRRLVPVSKPILDAGSLSLAQQPGNFCRFSCDVMVKISADVGRFHATHAREIGASGTRLTSPP